MKSHFQITIIHSKKFDSKILSKNNPNQKEKFKK